MPLLGTELIATSRWMEDAHEIRFVAHVQLAGLPTNLKGGDGQKDLRDDFRCGRTRRLAWVEEKAAIYGEG
jgi:hypothetical protein